MTPSSSSVRNADIMRAIDALARQVQERDEPLEARLDELTTSLNDLTRRISALEVALSKESRRDACPFRDEIVSASNNKERIIKLEDKTHKIELQNARAGVYGGATGSVVSGIIVAIGKALGWW